MLGYLTCFSVVIFACELLFCLPNLRLRRTHPALLAAVALAYLVCANSKLLTAVFGRGWVVAAVAMGVFLASVVAIHLLFEASWSLSFFFGAAGYATENLVFYIRRAEQYFPWFPASGPVAAPLKLLLVAVVLALVYWLLVRRYKDGGAPEVSNRFMLCFVVLTLFVTDLLNTWVRMEHVQLPVTAIYAYVCNIMLLMIQFGVFQRTGLEREREVTLEVMRERERQQRISAETMGLINRKCHDLKHQIAALRVMGDDERDRSIDELTRAVMLYDSFVRTGNGVLDTILTEKRMLCEGRQIDFTCIVDADRLQGLDAVDLHTIFSVALDNAIEAAAEVDDPDERMVSLHVGGQGALTRISVENTCVGPVAFEDGLPVAPAPGEGFRGRGIRGIRLAAEHHGGNMVASSSDGTFSLSVLLPALAERA